MKVALIQLAYDDAEPLDRRTERAAALVRGQAGHDLVVLPELWGATGFDYRRWRLEAQDLDGPIARAMGAAARDAGVTLHAGSIVERLPEAGRDGNTLANTSLLFSADGSRLAIYRKIHRFGFSAGEPDLMEAGDEIVLAEVPANLREPDGEQVILGLSTCYDLRFPELYRAQVKGGAQVFVVPAAWPLSRVGHWELLGRARAVEDQCFVVQCNTGGTHAGMAMGGGSQVVSPTGEVLAVAGAGEQVLSVEIDLAEIDAYRAAFPVLADRRL